LRHNAFSGIIAARRRPTRHKRVDFIEENYARRGISCSHEDLPHRSFTFSDILQGEKTLPTLQIKAKMRKKMKNATKKNNQSLKKDKFK
jgi:hypothetical protein